jgi:hypothetical protein
VILCISVGLLCCISDAKVSNFFNNPFFAVIFYGNDKQMAMSALPAKAMFVGGENLLL